MILRASVPVTELSHEELAAVDQCLEAPQTTPSGADRFVYRLRLGDRETLVQEERVPPGLQSVLRRLSGSWH